jgi:integrase
MGEFMQELRQRSGTAFRGLEFAILRASRSGEALGADWKEIDLDAGTWTIPGARMKMGKDHRVALSKAGIELLRTMPTRNGPVFPGKSKQGSLTHNAFYRALEQMNRPEVKWKDRDGEAITVHGFRSTFRT